MGLCAPQALGNTLHSKRIRVSRDFTCIKVNRDRWRKFTFQYFIERKSVGFKFEIFQNRNSFYSSLVIIWMRV